mgnify:CR=1 FL=1
MKKSILKKWWKNKWWIILGVISLLATAISSIIRSLNGYDFFSNIYLIIDWFAACIIYFYIGAMIGHIIDYVQNKKITHPPWFWMIIVFWVICTITLIFIADRTKISMIGIFLFPLAYGIFLLGMTFTIIFPDSIVNSYYGKLLFDVIFMTIFGFWLYYEYKDRRKILRKILLLIIFAVFILGFIGCATQLS